MNKAKTILLKFVAIVILAMITGILASAFEDYRIKTAIAIFYGYCTCYILNYEKFKDDKQEGGIKQMEKDKKCPFLDKYNGDGVEETDGHDYYSCRILINEDMKKYDHYCSFDRICDVLNYEECEIYKKENMKQEERKEQKVNNKRYKRWLYFGKNVRD